MARKLVSFTDTRSEALRKQRMFARKGKATTIKKEFGGFAVRIGTGKPILKRRKRKTSRSIF